MPQVTIVVDWHATNIYVDLTRRSGSKNFFLTAKAVFYRVEDEMVIVTIRGDYDVNETKLRNLLGGSEPRLATGEEVKAAGWVPGSASAVGLKGIRSIVDDSITMGSNYLAGAN